ncbi:MAG: serine/threonine protein kinase [Polyangiaceae bacterium]|nr:serine/threonine protein kinase [Polyangiaceae bacterium]
MSLFRLFRDSGARSSGPVHTRERSARQGGSHADLSPGDSVGEYRIVRRLGEGGFGAVYAAAHPVIGKRAAVKVLHPQYSADEVVTSRFVAEARAVNQIRDRNIVDIFSFGALPDGRHYYVMELLEGIALDAYLERAGRLPVPEALAILRVLANAIAAAHDAGIAHRDLKPGNVFLELDDEGNVYPKVLDFGMAKLLGAGAPAVHKTRSGTPIGSPRYMSPEQCRGVEVDHRTDIYAFGCIAYRMLTGMDVFDGPTALELMMAHVSAAPPSPSSRCAEIDAHLDEPILKLLEKEPDKRPQTMHAAYESLAAGAHRAGQDLSDSGMTVTPLLRTMVEEREVAGLEAVEPSRWRTFAGSQSASGRLRAWALGAALGGAALVGVLALAATRRHVAPESELSPPVASAAPIAEPAPASEPADSAAPAPSSTVEVTVRSRPVQAEIYHNDRRLGVTPGPVSLPRGEAPQTLVLRAPRYAPAAIEVRPIKDQSLDVTLAFRASVPSRAQLPRDLENPY